MAEKTDQISMSNEGNKTVEDNSPELSAGKTRAAKKVPHYLRASTGSCHDACKYGHPHKFKDKPVRPPRRRLSAPLPNGEQAVEIQIFVDKKVKKVVQSELEFPSAKESPPAITKSDKKFPSSRKSPVLDSSILAKQKAGSVTKSSSDPPKLIKKVVQSSGKSSLSDTSKETRQVASAAQKKVSPKQIPLNPKASSGALKPTVRRERPLFSTESSVRLSGKKTKESSVSDNSRTSRNAIMKTSGPLASTLSRRTSKVEVKKPLNAATTGRNLKVQNQRGQATQAFASDDGKDNIVEHKEHTDEKVEEKTLHMIEVKEDDHSSTAPDAGLLVHSPTPLSPESLNSSSQATSLSFNSHEVDEQCDLDAEYTYSEDDGSISNYDSSGDTKASDSSKEGRKLTQDSAGQHHPESLNLKFRRGKVVDQQSKTHSPRRLRFRPGRTLGDNQGANSGAQRKSYRKKAVEHSKKEEESGMLKVVLKHQEMEAKKDEQVLLNNVIEETASKLVEKKRSKVKALVGAFETVISLQEPKSSAADR